MSIKVKETKKGYDVIAVDHKSTPKPNGYIHYNGKEIKLWIFDVQTSFGMSGSTSQSARTRTFFAHNYNQPAISVSAQFPGQKEMAKFVEFVRRTHLGMESTVSLEIISGRPNGSKGHNRNKYGYKSHPHQNIVAKGYIKSVKRIHEAHVTAPELTFDFIVAKMEQPTQWADSRYRIQRFTSWHAIVDKLHGFNGTGVADPDDNSDNDKSYNSRAQANLGGKGKDRRPT